MRERRRRERRETRIGRRIVRGHVRESKWMSRCDIGREKRWNGVTKMRNRSTGRMKRRRRERRGGRGRERGKRGKRRRRGDREGVGEGSGVHVDFAIEIYQTIEKSPSTDTSGRQ